MTLHDLWRPVPHNCAGGKALQLGMGRKPQLQKALDKLRKSGKKIGNWTEWNGKPAIDVDGVLMSEEQVFQVAEISPED